MADREKERAYEAYLVASARVGDGTALEELIARWHPRLVAQAWRLTGDPELARDMAQEAWLEILRGLARLDDADAFPAWAMRILSRRCAKAIGRLKRRRDSDMAFAQEPASHVVDGEAEGELKAAQQTLEAAIAALPSGQHAALGLFYREEMSVAEIAIALDIPVGTVKTRLMHARRKLREMMKGDDDD